MSAIKGAKEAVLRIKLRSDLCVGSGYSYAGVIDTDICYDEYGIPYIPAKRIRGCLRETLEECLYSLYSPGQVEDLFGRAGRERASRFVIGNARIHEYEKRVNEIQSFRAHEDRAHFYGTQEILDRFTHVVAQTAIQENGTANDNTLRYTRVVNRISPLSKKGDPLEFEAKVSFPAEHETMLTDAVFATRHIGLKRNRGFGNVSCKLTNVHEVPAGEAIVNKDNRVPEFSTDPSGRKRLSVRVRNTDPLMLSAAAENESATYISGQSLLGLLAGRYLKKKGSSAAETEEFFNLFLNGQTIFSNLYPSDKERIYYPAPVYINKLKLTGKYINALKSKLPEESETRKEYAVFSGNPPKKLKGEYVSFGKGELAVREVERDSVYHHSHIKKNADGEEGILYGMEVLRPNQVFEGFIETSNDQNAKELEKLLYEDEGELYFGKSKSSQYGHCVLEKIPERETGVGDRGKPIAVKANQHLVVTFLSDAIFLANRGEYTVYRDEIEAIAADQLGIADKISAVPEDNPVYLSNILTTLSTGYRTVWNLRREAVPAIQAGSCLVYHLLKDCTVEREFLGERNLEGYGQIRMDVAEGMTYELESSDDRRLNEAGTVSPGKESPEDKAPEKAENSSESTVSPETKNLLERLLADRWVKELVTDYLRRGTGRIHVTNSALGRITLMLRESLESGTKGDYKAQFEDLCKRVQSIKSTSVRREGEAILSMVASRNGKSEWVLDLSRRQVNVYDGSSDGGNVTNQIREELFALETAGSSSGFDADSRIDSLINARWGEYLTIVLTEQKYMGGDQ